MMEFCKSFNDKTKNFKESTPIPVVITAFSGSDTLACPYDRVQVYGSGLHTRMHRECGPLAPCPPASPVICMLPPAPLGAQGLVCRV